MGAEQRIGDRGGLGIGDRGCVDQVAQRARASGRGEGLKIDHRQFFGGLLDRRDFSFRDAVGAALAGEMARDHRHLAVGTGMDAADERLAQPANPVGTAAE